MRSFTLHVLSVNFEWPVKRQDKQVECWRPTKTLVEYGKKKMKQEQIRSWVHKPFVFSRMEPYQNPTFSTEDRQTHCPGAATSCFRTCCSGGWSRDVFPWVFPVCPSTCGACPSFKSHRLVYNMFLNTCMIPYDVWCPCMNLKRWCV